MNNRFVVPTLVAGLLASTVALAEPFTADTLVRLDRVGAPALSPDGSKLVYSLRTTDMEANKGVYDLWWTGFSDGDTHQLTTHAANDTDPAWSPDGESVYFLSTRSGTSQVWRIALGGGEAVQVTDLPIDVGTFRVAPDGDSLVLSASVYLDCEDLACTASREQAKERQSRSVVFFMSNCSCGIGTIGWMHKHSQLFALALDESGAGTGEPVLLSKGVRADIPSRVWGGVEEYTVSPDGSTVYFVARIRDRDEPVSTNYRYLLGADER